MSFTPDNCVVWAEIPVRNLEKSMAFYATAFGYELSIDNTGPNPVAMFPSDGTGVAGHLYPGEPAKEGSGPTIHMAVPDTLEETAKRWFDAGGAVKSDPITIPPGRFQYVLDLDGNSIGLFELNKG